MPRFASIASFALLLLSLALPARADDPPPSERAVRFPDYESFGELFVYPWGSRPAAPSRKIGSALGEVKVPAGMELGLEFTGRDLSVLALLKPGDLQALIIHAEARIQPADLKYLADYPPLRRLSIAVPLDADKTARDFISKIRGLRWLDLAGVVTPAIVASLKSLPALERLNIAGTRLSAAEFQDIAQIKSLKAIGLAGAAIGPEELRGICALPALEELNLNQANLPDPSALFGLANLRTLDLDHAKLGKPPLDAIAGMKRLERLNLGGWKVADERTSLLAGLSELRFLDLRDADLGPATAPHLARLRKLESLDLRDSKLDDESLAALAPLTELRSLDIQRSWITDKGMVTFAKFEKLEKLTIGSDRVTDAGLAKLQACASLKSLNAYGCSITADGAAALQAALPDCRIVPAFPPREPSARPAPIAGGGFDPKTPPPARSIKFPGDASVGRVEIRPWNSPLEIDPHETKWRQIGEARWDVAIPAGQEARLSVGSTDRWDYTPLRKLRSGDLQAIAFTLPALTHGDPLPLIEGLTGLRELTFHHPDLGADSLSRLSGMDSLEALAIVRANFSDASLARLKPPPSLRILRLSRTRVSHDGLGPLAAFPKLEVLSLDGTLVGPACVEALSKLKGLKRLELGDTFVDASTIKKLREALPGCEIDGPSGNRRIARSGPFDVIDPATLKPPAAKPARLPARDIVFPEGLTIMDASFRDAGETDPAAWRGFYFASHEDRLRVPSGLDLRLSVGEKAGLRWLATIPPDLAQGLDLCELQVDEADFANLARLKGLKVLEIACKSRSCEGIEKLAALPALHALDLFCAPVDSSAIPRLAKLKNLRALALRSAKWGGLDDAGLQALRAALPDCRIVPREVGPSDDARPLF